MKSKLYWYSLGVLFCLFYPRMVVAQTKDNQELQKMYEDDQNARKVANIDWQVLNKQDSIRQKRVNELIKEGKIKTGKDYYHSAMIFQHGTDTLASSMAVKQMRKAIEIDSTVDKWLLAAAIDRDLMRRNKPQIYGTQYIRKGENAKWERYAIDTTQVSDKQRTYYGVETLVEQKTKEYELNSLPISEAYLKTNSLDEVIKVIKTDYEKGTNGTYNVSENAINAFGYSLMNENKNDEALRIFKLNTELYPKGYNTFDSYGECLLKLNKVHEAVKAYKKSLELNPNNKQAKKVIEKYQ